MPVVLVRHAAVTPDPTVDPRLWELSDAGRAAARALAAHSLWRAVPQVFASTEYKALETAHILAGPNGMNVTAVSSLVEVHRPDGSWIPDDYPGGYPGAVADYFAAPTEAVHGWEPAGVAQARLVATLAQLQVRLGDTFVVVGHGMTLSLLIAALTGVVPFTIWPHIRQPDVAILDVNTRRLWHPFGTPLPVDERVWGGWLAPTAGAGDPP